MQFFKPENYFIVRQALIRAKRKDLIGTGPNALIPPQPPPGAIEARQNERPRAAGVCLMKEKQYPPVIAQDANPPKGATVAPIEGANSREVLFC